MQKNLFWTVNMITLVSSVSTSLSWLIDLCNKKEWTWVDCYHFGMVLFINVNVMIKPKTIQGVFESEQLKYLNEIERKLDVTICFDNTDQK